MTTLELLARAKSGEGVKSGPIGLAVILLLCIAAYFLFKSMSKHLRRVRENFPEDGSTAAATRTEAAAPDIARQAAPTAPDAPANEEQATQPPPPLPPSAPPPPPPDATQ